jgi:hypothetical protein
MCLQTRAKVNIRGSSGHLWKASVPVSSVKDERQEKLEVMVLHKFLMHSMVPFGRAHFNKTIGSSGPARQKPLIRGQVDAAIPDTIKDDRFE